MKFLFVMLVAISTSALAAPQKEYVTVTGAVYTLEPNAPAEMQPAYRDPKGLIWGDIWKTTDQFPEWPSWTSQNYAEIYCASIKLGNKTARLPSPQEFARLRDSMSLTPAVFDQLESYNTGYDTSKPALPNLAFLFWSEVFPSQEDRYAWIFDGGAKQPLHLCSKNGCGYIEVKNHNYEGFTRCVIDL